MRPKFKSQSEQLLRRGEAEEALRTKAGAVDVWHESYEAEWRDVLSPDWGLCESNRGLLGLAEPSLTA